MFAVTGPVPVRCHHLVLYNHYDHMLQLCRHISHAGSSNARSEAGALAGRPWECWGMPRAFSRTLSAYSSSSC
jgi:hypothetical protein